MADINAGAPLELGSRGEEMVTWFMQTYSCDRDPAIGALVTFLNGWGQPSTDMFVKFPELAALYYKAVASRSSK